MPISTTQARTSLKNLYGEGASLSASSLITLYEIDIETIGTDQGLIFQSEDQKIFRFHNNLNLTSESLVYQGKTYSAAPIKGEGFELTARGTLPTPKLSLTVNDTGLQLFGLFKDRLRSLGDLTGAKVTRIRTFAKYLDAVNWGTEIPDGFAPDQYSEYPRDIYYIERKSNENKFTLEFELSSILDVENIQLPARLIFANRCPARYRGEGCCYEYRDRQNADIHGTDATLPLSAPPVATEKDELISTIIGTDIKSPQVYDANKLSTYVIGSSVYISKNGLLYYFVAKTDSPSAGPPDTRFWISDQCSHFIPGCRIRWGTDGSVDLGGAGFPKGYLPFLGFPGTDKIR